MTPEQERERNERLARAREARLAKLRAASENPAEGSPVESEQVAPVTSDAGEPGISLELPPEPEDDLNPFAESSVPDETLGRMAEALAGNEVAAEAHRAAYREILLAWANTALDARDLREELYHDYRAQMRFRDKLVGLSRGSKVRDRNKAAMKVVR